MLRKGGCGCGSPSPPRVPPMTAGLMPNAGQRAGSPAGSLSQRQGSQNLNYGGTPTTPDIPKERRRSSEERRQAAQEKVAQEKQPSLEKQPSQEKKPPVDEKPKKWLSPLRQFDTFATAELKKREIAEEDFPKLQVPQMKGQHKCKVQAITNHTVDTAIEMEQELRNIGIQQTFMLEMLEKLTKAEAACRFQGAVRAAEVAAMSAPPELAEEAAVAGARGYTVDVQEFSKKSRPGENPIEIIGYIGCTRPNNF